jgi:hypothetical protein
MSEEDDMELEPTEEELREAAALAQALDRGSARDGLPDDALQMAAMLRYGTDGGELGEERSDALLEEALRTARPRRPRAEKGAWWRWLVPAGLVTAAAAAALVGVLATRGGEAPTTAAALPEPPSSLLQAQAAAAAGDDPEALDRAMEAHRAAVLERLGERYER